MTVSSWIKAMPFKNAWRQQFLSSLFFGVKQLVFPMYLEFWKNFPPVNLFRRDRSCPDVQDFVAVVLDVKKMQFCTHQGHAVNLRPRVTELSALDDPHAFDLGGAACLYKYYRLPDAHCSMSTCAVQWAAVSLVKVVFKSNTLSCKVPTAYAAIFMQP